ncbi:MAG: LysR family transcriptional regulator [Myxococcota bacterium]
MTLDWLRTFLAVYRAGSLTEAAPLVGLSQPAVTAQLRALEAHLGQPLFERGARGVSPTAAADALAQRVADPLDALAAVGDDLRADPFARAVQLGGPAEYLAARAVPALAPLVARGLQLRIRPGLPDALLEDLRAGRLDLALCTVKPRGGGLRVVPVYEEVLVLVGRGPVPKAPTWVAYAEDLPLIRRYWRQVHGRLPPGRVGLVVPDLRAVGAAVAAGAGHSVLPRYLCGGLPVVAGAEVTNTLYLALRAGPAPPIAVAAVRDALSS